MSYIDIDILTKGVELTYNDIPDVDNFKTYVPNNILATISHHVDGRVVVTLVDGRTWNLSTIVDYKPETFPIKSWGGVDLVSNEELYEKVKLLKEL